MSKSRSKKRSKPMKKADASRIQSSTAIQNGGNVSKDSFAAKAQRAAEHNEKPTT